MLWILNFAFFTGHPQRLSEGYFSRCSLSRHEKLKSGIAIRGRGKSACAKERRTGKEMDPGKGRIRRREINYYVCVLCGRRLSTARSLITAFGQGLTSFACIR